VPVQIDAVTSVGFTPLHLAAHQGHTKCVELLLSNGANIDAVTRVSSVCVCGGGALMWGPRRRGWRQRPGTGLVSWGGVEGWGRG
jgi:hypothetical protein